MLDLGRTEGIFLSAFARMACVVWACYQPVQLDAVPNSSSPPLYFLIGQTYLVEVAQLDI
jgi:hypothetical protein